MAALGTCSHAVEIHPRLVPLLWMELARLGRPPCVRVPCVLSLSLKITSSNPTAIPSTTLPPPRTAHRYSFPSLSRQLSGMSGETYFCELSASSEPSGLTPAPVDSPTPPPTLSQAPLLTASRMISQSSLGGAGATSAGIGVGMFGARRDPSSSDDPEIGPAEDAREGYGSQAALTEPPPLPPAPGIPHASVLTQENESSRGATSSQSSSSSQSQGETMSPVFSRTSRGVTPAWRRRVGGVGAGAGGSEGKEEEGGEGEDLVIEMSHVNREPCMRSLLLVVEAERKLFGRSWQEEMERTQGQ